MTTGGTTRRLGGQAPNVGLLVDWLEDEYQNTVMAGAVDGARERGFSFTAFCGGVLDASDRNGQDRNHCFELATSASVSGLLVLGGTLGNHSGPVRLTEYLKRYHGIPRCSVGIPLQGMPSVLVDNKAGMREAVEHLLDAHGKRRIFFVRGPDVNEEAESRFGIFRQVLGERGIDVDPRLSHIGNFQPSAGRDAITRALDQGLEFDAVVAANDSMAMGALEALRARGVRVPEDVALIGFDDVEEARFIDPPLTTVRQPLYEQGRQAVRLLVAQMQGSHPGDVTLRTELVRRRSCGCSSTGTALLPETTPLGFEAMFVTRRELIAADLVRAARAAFGGLGAGWERRLLGALVDELLGTRPGAFLSAYQEVLGQAYRVGNPVDAWHDVLSAVRRHALSGLQTDFARYRTAESLFDAARLLTSEVVERAQARKRLEAEHLARKMARAGAALIARFDEQALFDACLEHLPELGIETTFIVERKASGAVSEILFGRSPEGRTARGTPVPSDHLLPPQSMPAPPFSCVVEPLLLGDQMTGYAVFSLGPRNGTVYESLRDQISAALQGARLARS